MILPRVDRPLPGVLLLTFEADDRDLLVQAMCRAQEHYESPCPDFRGNAFSMGDFIKWYSREYGGWTYEQDWEGFNVPASAVEALAAMKGFLPLDQYEAWLVGLVQGSGARYVIASFEGCQADVVPHELSHALWRVDDRYRRECIQAVLEHPLLELREHLAQLGYDRSVHDDECHAYVGESFDYLASAGIPYPEELRVRLQETKSAALARIK